LELAPLPPGFLFTMLQEGVSDEKAVGRLRCQLPEILVPIGKGRFQAIGNEYGGHSADTYYLRIVKRMPLASGVHKPLMGITPKNSLADCTSNSHPGKQPLFVFRASWQMTTPLPRPSENE
jgi:hypothetical protein